MGAGGGKLLPSGVVRRPDWPLPWVLVVVPLSSSACGCLSSTPRLAPCVSVSRCPLPVKTPACWVGGSP